MSGQWPGQEVTTPPGTPTGGFIPAPGYQDQQAREEMRDTRDANRDQRDVQKTGFDQIGNLRKEFYALKPVQEYQAVVRQFASTLNTGEDAAGDQSLIISYAKMLDPGSVVRESEFDTTAQADGAFGRTLARVKREFGLSGGGRLTPEGRTKLRREMLNLVKGYESAYQQQRQQYEGLAQSYGFDPMQVIGPDFGEPYRDSIAEIEASFANSPEMVGDVPKGSQVEFGMDRWGEDDPFNRADYLQDTYGISPNQEAAITAFWNANIGNQQLTPEAVKAWYESQGIAPPADADLMAGIERAIAGEAAFGSFDTSQAEADYLAALDQIIAERGIDPEAMSETAAQSTASGATLGFVDELGGLGGGVRGLLQGNSPVGGYQVERDVMRRLRERGAAANPKTALAGELVGGFATGALGIGGRGRSAMEIARGLRASGQAVSRGAIRGGQVRDAAREGAKIGAVAGAGYGEGLEGTAGGAAFGAVTGGGLGAGIQRGVQALQGRFAGRPAAQGPMTDGQEVIGAADRLNAQFGTNIRPLPADVAGPGIRNASGGAAKMTISGALIGRQAERLTDEAEKAKNAIVNLVGGSADPELAGEIALAGARKWMQTSATRRDALYARARKEGGNEPVDMASARQVLDGHIAELSQTPGSAEGLARLQALRAELDNPFPVEGVKRMRTRLRDDFGSDGLRATDIERRVGQVIDAAEDDIVASLTAAGKPDAARLYQRAAQAHRERVEVIDQVLAPIIGPKGDAPKSGEQIIGAIERAARGNSAQLGRFMKALPAEDAGIVRGTVIDRLGRATSGQQNDVGDAFSLQTFLTNWDKMSSRSKSTLFGGELRASLDDLAKVAAARRESGKSVNFSNTGGTMGQLASGAALAGATVNPWSLGLFVFDGVTGALLSSPKFARWLAKMPDKPAAQKVHVQNLSRIAANDNVIAADAMNLQQQLMARLEGGAAGLAAEDQDTGAGSNTTGSERQ